MTTDRQPPGSDAAVVLALFGSKAGVGTSVVAANLAVALRRREDVAVVLVEAHYDLGNLASLLDLAPERHVGHALKGSLAAALIRHRSGIEVLLRSPEGEAPTPEQLRALLLEARGHARYVVVDSASGYDPVFHALLEEADYGLMITTPEATALRHAERILHQAVSWGVAPKLRVAVNRWESESAVDPGQLRTLLGDRLVGRLPSAGWLAVQAANAGQPFVVASADHPLSQAVLALADWLRGQIPAARGSR